MSKTITIRLPDDLLDWLEHKARETGLPKGRIIREQIEKARANQQLPAFLDLAGCIEGSPNLSTKRGFEP